MKRVYLDFAAATPVDERVMAEMMPFYSENFYNPSALYQEARESKSSLDKARSEVAKQIGAKPSEVLFLAGGTESDNLAINGIISKFKDGHLISSVIEHDAVYEPVKNVNHTFINVEPSGLLNLELLEESIQDYTVLVSIMLVNNEIGTIQPVDEVVKIVQKIRRDRLKKGNRQPIFVHTDACQAPLYLDINVSRLGVDLMTLNGGKIHGPKQSGILYVRSGIDLVPIIRGGGQEFGYRSGTENVAQAVGFAKALSLATKNRTERVKKVSELRDYFIDQLETRFNAELNGSIKKRISNNVNVMFKGKDNERILFALDDMGVAAAAGSACSASKETSSRVLLAIGRTDDEARSSVRFSLGITSTKQEIDFVLDKLSIALKA